MALIKAILKGFPPSNTISCGISLGKSDLANPGWKYMGLKIIEKEVTLSQLRVEDRFKIDFTGDNIENPQSFMIIEKIADISNWPDLSNQKKSLIRAVCYDESNINKTFNIERGEIYNFEGCEKVLWVQRTTGEGLNPSCCRGCGAELIKDSFGEYCPNLWCKEIS